MLVFAEGAAAHGGEAAAKVDDPHLDEAQANHQHHHPAHGRGDHPLEIGQHQGGAHHQEGPDEGDPEQGRDDQLLVQAIFFHGAAKRNHHGDEGEVDRLDGEQPRADGAVAVHLQPGADAGGDHRHGDQVSGGLGGEAESPAHDEGRRHHGHEDGQQVGHGPHQGLVKGRFVFERVNQVRVLACCFRHLDCPITQNVGGVLIPLSGAGGEPAPAPHLFFCYADACCSSLPSSRRICSGVKCHLRSQTPQASWMAVAMAGAAPLTPISEMDLAP